MGEIWAVNAIALNFLKKLDSTGHVGFLERLYFKSDMM